MIRKLALALALVAASIAFTTPPPASANPNSGWDWDYVEWLGVKCVYKGRHWNNPFGYPIADTVRLYNCGQAWVKLDYTWGGPTWTVGSLQTTGDKTVVGRFGATAVNSKHLACTYVACDIPWWRH
jgi:hypothetical protein